MCVQDIRRKAWLRLVFLCSPPHRRLFYLPPQLDLLKERLQLVEANSIVNHQRVVNVVTVTLALALKRVFNRQAYDISAEACVFRAGLWCGRARCPRGSGRPLARLSRLPAWILQALLFVTLTWKMCCAWNLLSHSFPTTNLAITEASPNPRYNIEDCLFWIPRSLQKLAF